MAGYIIDVRILNGLGLSKSGLCLNGPFDKRNRLDIGCSLYVGRRRFSVYFMVVLPYRCSKLTSIVA
jgi:hypothetical protein